MTNPRDGHNGLMPKAMMAHYFKPAHAVSAYRRRMTWALVISVAAHGLLALPQWAERTPAPAPESPEPIVLSLRPDPEPEPPRRLVDALVESEPPSEPTPLIAEVDAAASDMSAGDEETGTPNLPMGDFEQIGGAAATAPAIAPPPAPEPEPVAEPEEVREEEPLPERAAEPMRTAAVIPERVTPPRPAPTPPQAAPTPEERAPQPPAPREAAPQTPVMGEAQNLGFLGHEAMRHEVAPYLKQVRDAVEKRWKIAIQLRYTGTDPTRAVVDCAIRPDGTLALVEVVDHGGAIGYAALCKDAIERAAPFPPFPFEVPELYQNENLRIRWTFSFL